MSATETKYYLVDAVEYQKLHPTTFELPDEYNRCRVQVGEWAKLMFVFPTEPKPKVERMWVKVLVVEPDWYGGSVDNIPDTEGFGALGGRLKFEPRHIISIWPPRAYFGSLLLQQPDDDPPCSALI